MTKYVVVNGSFWDADNSVSMVGVYDDLEKAEKICNDNIAEDFGYNTYENFIKEEFPECDTYDWGIVYSIEYDLLGHEEVYKVYPIEV